MRVEFRSVPSFCILLASLCLLGCRDSSPPQFATLTFKSDGSHFSGTVIRTDGNSITLTSSSGDTHTYLYGELTDIKYGLPANPTDSKPAPQAPASGASGPSPASVGSASVPVPASPLIEFPAGTEFPVRSNGFLDSCCVPITGLALGVMDAAVKSPAGKVLVPEGANVTIELLEERQADGRTSMVFELASADFDGRHYVITSAKGGLEPGIRAIFTGAKDGTPEAKAHGLNVHVEDHAYMPFKAESTVLMKLSQ